MSSHPISQDASLFEQEVARRYAEARGRMSKNDELIFASLGNDLEQLPFDTSETLAQRTGVSRAAIVRFSRKLGYSGFAEFRAFCRASIQRTPSSPSAANAESEEARPLLLKKIESDRANLALAPSLSLEAIGPTADALARAREIFVVGNRETFALAVSLQRRLHNIRRAVHLLEAGYTELLRDGTEADVLFACTIRPYSRITLNMLDYAKRHHMQTVVLTDGRGHAFLDGVDHVLVASTQSPALYDSLVVPLSLLECLVSEVAQLLGDEADALLDATEMCVTEQRLVLE